MGDVGVSERWHRRLWAWNGKRPGSGIAHSGALAADGRARHAQ
jgi:hypothetical protein